MVCQCAHLGLLSSARLCRFSHNTMVSCIFPNNIRFSYQKFPYLSYLRYGAGRVIKVENQNPRVDKVCTTVEIIIYYYLTVNYLFFFS